jgi:phage gpG-like protein
MIIGKIDSRQVDILFRELKQNSQDLSPALRMIEQELLDSIEDIFETEGHGNWPKLHPKTVEAREKEGKAGMMLQKTGQLVASIQSGGQITSNEVIVGTNVPYAGFLQEGTTQNVTAKQRMWLGKNLGLWMKVGAKITMPARPFLEITDEVAMEAENILADHLLKGIK